MPSSSAEKAQQQPVGSGSGFPSANLYPSKNIWSSFPQTNRDRAAGSKGAYLLVLSMATWHADCVSAANPLTLTLILPVL